MEYEHDYCMEQWLICYCRYCEAEVSHDDTILQNPRFKIEYDKDRTSNDRYVYLDKSKLIIGDPTYSEWICLRDLEEQ